MELFADILATAFEALKNGRTLLYPTDTIWGIGCDAANGDAVERIYAIKERDHSKAMLLLVTASMLSRNMPDEVRGLLLESERPTTVIVPADMVCRRVAENLPAGDGTIGVRVPRMDFCQQLLEKILEEAGYSRYEISNFSKVAKSSIHNRVYREMEDYLGL